MPTTRKSAKTTGAKGRTDIAASYNAVKNFQGQRYTGMRVGRGHTWNYDAGQWKETKVTPDEWTFTYAVTKRRKGKAPEGSGVPVGTEYHWYILAHQTVKKLNANDYSTCLEGTKYKLAHRRAEKEKWSISETTQRRHLVKLLESAVAELSQDGSIEAPAVAASLLPPESRRTALTSAHRKSPRHSTTRRSTSHATARKRSVAVIDQRRHRA